MPPKITYIQGQKIGSCIYIKELNRVDRHALALFKCHCGVEFKTRVDNVKNGRQKGCGCLNRASRVVLSARTHGKSKTKIYGIWLSMRNRCRDPKNQAYKNYGGRGISVCDEWNKSFSNFYRDMGERPSPRHSLDRRDNSLGYCKENCRWATIEEQSNNRRNTLMVELKGEMKTLSDLSAICGLSRQLIGGRIRKGWSVEKSIASRSRNELKQSKAIVA